MWSPLKMTCSITHILPLISVQIYSEELIYCKLKCYLILGSFDVSFNLVKDGRNISRKIIKNKYTVQLRPCAKFLSVSYRNDKDISKQTRVIA